MQMTLSSDWPPNSNYRRRTLESLAGDACLFDWTHEHVELCGDRALTLDGFARLLEARSSTAGISELDSQQA